MRNIHAPSRIPNSISCVSSSLRPRRPIASNEEITPAHPCTPPRHPIVACSLTALLLPTRNHSFRHQPTQHKHDNHLMPNPAPWHSTQPPPGSRACARASCPIHAGTPAPVPAA